MTRPRVDMSATGLGERLREDRYVHVALLVLAVTATFGGSLAFGFVWDDTMFILDNSLYEDLDPGRIFLSLQGKRDYLPVRDLSIAMDFALWGAHPAGFHLTNVVLLCLTAVLVYFLTEAVLGMAGPAEEGHRTPVRIVALFCSLIFVLHPMRCEVVSFVSHRNVLLGGVFCLAAALCFLRFLATDGSAARGHYAAALAATLLAFLSKQTAIVLPLALSAMVLLVPRKRRGAAALVPLFIAAAVAFVLHKAAAENAGLLHGGHRMFGSLAFSPRLSVALQVPFFYLRQHLFPAGLSVDYADIFVRDLTSPTAVAATVGLGALVATAVRLGRKHAVAAFGLAWYLVFLLPVSNIFLTHPVVADRYAYLPSYGLVLSTAPLVFRAGGRVRPRVLMGPLAAMVLVLGAWSLHDNRIWRSDEDLWRGTLAVSPSSVTALQNLGRLLYDEGRYEEAFTLLERSASLDPASTVLDQYRALYHFNRGDYRLAIAEMEGLLDRQGTTVPAGAAFILGQAYERTGDAAQALRTYRRALESGARRTDPNLRSVAAALAQLQSRLEPRLAELRARAAQAPEDTAAHMALAAALNDLGRPEEALPVYRRLAAAAGETPDLLFRIAETLTQMHLYKEAAAVYERVLELDAENHRALINVAALHKRLKRYDRAIEVLQRAMAVEPRSFLAPYDLGLIYYQMGDRSEALRYLRRAAALNPGLARTEIAGYLAELE